MLLQSLEYNVIKLLNSDVPVAVCPANGKRLKSLVLLVQEAGYGVVVVRTTGDDDYVFAIAGRKQQGKLVGDTQKWSRDQGYQFVVKRRDEHFLTTTPSHLVLPDGREIQILGTDTVASVFTQRVLSGRKPLPDGFVRL